MRVIIETDKTFTAKFAEKGNGFEVGVQGLQNVIVGGADVYTGEYVATPKTTEQMLETKDKLMKNNVTIKQIPYFDVSNTSGGSTVYIANEV